MSLDSIHNATGPLRFAVEAAHARAATAPPAERAQFKEAQAVVALLSEGLASLPDVASARALLREARGMLGRVFSLGAAPPAYAPAADVAADLVQALGKATAVLDEQNIAAMPFFTKHAYAVTMAILGLIALSAGGLSVV